MKLGRRLLAATTAMILTAAAVSISAFTASADTKVKNYLKTIPAGDVLVNPIIQTSTWTFVDPLSSPNTEIISQDKVKGLMQTYTPWAHLFSWGHKTTIAQDGKVTVSTDTVAPAGISPSDGADIVPAEVISAAVGKSGTYTVGVKGFHFDEDVAGQTADANGCGWNLLGISTSFPDPERDENGNPVGGASAVTIKNVKLNFYDTEEAYTSGKPTKTKTPASSYWVTQRDYAATRVADYTQFMFVNNSTISGTKDSTTGITSTIPSGAQSNSEKKSLDAFKVSGFSGKKSSATKTGYAGPTDLPNYAFTITFDIDVPNSFLTQTPDSAALKAVIDEAQVYADDKGTQTLAQIAAAKGLTVEEVKKSITDGIQAATKAYTDNKDVKSASKSALATEQKAINDATEALKKVLSDLGILVWGELEGAIEDAGKLVEADYTGDSWSKLATALAAGKELQTKFANGEAVTQEEIDAAVKAIKDAVEGLVTFTPAPDTTSGLAYLQIADKNGDQKWYNDGNTYKVTPTTTKVDTEKSGETYTVSAKAGSTATGIADLNVEVKNLKTIHEDAVVTIDKVTIDGTDFKLAGVPYTVKGDAGEAVVPLYDATVTAIPEGAATAIGKVLASDASPTAVSTDGNTAVDTEWNEVAVTFTVNWTADEESKAPADSKDDDETPNPDTAGGVAVAASLVTIVAAGYVVSRKRRK